MISNKTYIRKFNYKNGIYLPVTPCSVKCVFLPIHYLLTLYFCLGTWCLLVYACRTKESITRVPGIHSACFCS